MHPWMLSYYIDRFSTLMARLELCLQISQALAAGIDPQILHFNQRSRNLWGGTEVPAFHKTLPFLEKRDEPPRDEIQQWIPLVSDEKLTQEVFFQGLNRVKRPEIWIVEPTPKLLFDIYSENFINVRSVSFCSPGNMTLDIGSGLGEVIHELRYGDRREQREREQHEERMEQKHELHEEEMKQKTLETKLLEQEVISKALDNIKKAKEIGLIESLQVQLRKAVGVGVEDLETLNERTGAILAFPEKVDKAVGP